MYISLVTQFALSKENYNAFHAFCKRYERTRYFYYNPRTGASLTQI